MERKEFEELVAKALDELPGVFKDKFENVEVVVEGRPDMNIVKATGVGARGRLLGLYQGVPLKDRAHYYGMVLPDKITLYKENIEQACPMDGTGIYEKIKHVLEHEIAHHFGVSDQRLRDLDIY